MKNENLNGEMFLNEHFKNLNISDEVKHAIRVMGKDGKPVKVKDKDEALKIYLDRLKKVHDMSLKNSRAFDRLKRLYFQKYCIKRSDLEVILENGNNAAIDIIIKNQEESLEKWFDYLSSKDAKYPMWAKYWVFQGMLKIGNFDEVTGEYQKRSKKTFNPFIEVNPEIIAKCIELVVDFAENKTIDDEEIRNIVKNGNFAKLYTLLIAKNKKEVFRSDDVEDGIWVVYHHETYLEAMKKIEMGQKAEYQKLCDSLQGYNTGWCTASSMMARSQICGGDGYLGGDFYVYYTKDKNGEYKVPRIAIRMNGDDIGEIRGVAAGQNIEDGLEKIIEEKLKTIPNIRQETRERSLMCIEDAKKLSELVYKLNHQQDFSKEDIMFIYEANGRIHCFGYLMDPRIAKILKERNNQQDYDSLQNDDDKVKFIIGASSSYYLDLEIDDKNVMLMAVRQDGNAICYASEELKKDYDIVTVAVKNSPSSIQWVNPDFEGYKDLVLYAIEHSDSDYIISSIGSTFPGYKEVVHAAVKKYGIDVLIHVRKEFTGVKEYMLELADMYGKEVFEYCYWELRVDKDFMFFIAKKYGTDVLKYADWGLKEQREYINQVKETFGIEALKYVHQVDLTSEEQEWLKVLKLKDKLVVFKNNFITSIGDKLKQIGTKVKLIKKSIVGMVVKDEENKLRR